jgi:hypothetical protein
MPVPSIQYHAPGRARERLLLYGLEGVGKTFALFQIMSQTTGVKGRCNYYYIETDNTLDEFLESPNFNHLEVAEEWVGRKLDTECYDNPNGNIYLYRVRNWVDYTWAFMECFTRASGDDWIFIDNVSNLWGEVQSWYTTEAYGKSAADFALEIRKKHIANNDKKSTIIQEQFQDWGAINPQYMENIRKFIQNPPCHIAMTAEQKKVDMDKEKDKETRAIFGPFGAKPTGQKSIAHDARTVLWLTRDNRFGDTHLIQTAKDRERERLDKEEWSNMVKDYLFKVGNWKMVKNPDAG